VSGIWWERGEARVRKYSAATTGTRTVVRVEIEVTDHHALGYLLASIQREVAEQEPAPEKPPARQAQAKRIAQQSGVLMLPHFKGGQQ